MKLNSNSNRCGLAILPPLAAVYAGGLAVYVIALLLQKRMPGIAHDDGLIQLTTIAVLVGNLLFAAYRTWSTDGKRTNLGLITYILIFYALREADFHKFGNYPEHIANRRFYASAEIPMLDRVLFGALLLTLFAAIVVLLVRISPSLVKALRRTEDWAVYAVVWFITLVLTQVSDHSFFNDYFWGATLEEVGELVAAGANCLIVWRFPNEAPHKDTRPG
jgi:hypothetical protein